MLNHSQKIYLQPLTDFQKGPTRYPHDTFTIQPSSVIACLNFLAEDTQQLHAPFYPALSIWYLLSLQNLTFGAQSDKSSN